MKFRFLLFTCLMAMSLCNINLQAQSKGNIAWLGNNLKADSLYFVALSNAGYNVVDKTATKGDLTTTQIADLDTFDLVILSRSLNSGDYNFPAKYDAVQAPFLCMANMAARSNRLKWFSSPLTSDAGTVDVVAAIDLEHPIFNNLALSDSNTIDIATAGIKLNPILGNKSSGNGNLIGVTAKDSSVLIAEWDAKMPFYVGSTDSLHGKRMVYFNTQGSNLTASPYTSNLNDNGFKLLTNIAEYMITGTVEETTEDVLTDLIFITENIVDDSLYIDLLKKNNCNVNVVTNLKNVVPSDSAMAVLEAADVILISRNSTSGGYTPIKYNSLATPIMNMSSYMSRPSRWQLLEQESITNDSATVIVQQPTHPIFEGVTLGASNDVAINTTLKIDMCNIATAPNATVLAASVKTGYITIAEWKKNTKFYDKSTNSALGHRMAFFLSGRYDLSANGQTMFVNAVKYLATFDYDTVLVNVAPTGITLSKNSIAENAAIATEVGSLIAVDANTGDAWTYSFKAGAGDTDNSKFTIASNKLVSAEIFDFETKASYSVRISVTDTAGLAFEQVLAIAVTNVNEAPTAISLSNSTIDEGLAIGTLVGKLSATDIDAGTTFTYSLVAGDGTNDADNAKFAVAGDALNTNAILDFETKPSYAVNIQVTDGKLSFVKAFVVTVKNVIETGISGLSSKNIRIYPNPTADVLYIESLNASDATISIYDVNGQVVYQKSHSLDNVLELKLQIPSGIYILNVQGEKIQYTTRLVRQ